jgi:TatA/E family protein of Tat protein translocase
VVALLLFGGSGKISSIMGDVAKGIKSFKKGMTEDDTAAAARAGPLQEGRAEGSRQHRASPVADAGGACHAAAAGPAAQVNKVS